MANLGKNLPEVDRGFFPKVTSSGKQMRFVYNELLPKMLKEGLVKQDSFAELLRWSLERASETVGLDMPAMQHRARGRRRKVI